MLKHFGGKKGQFWVISFMCVTTSVDLLESSMFLMETLKKLEISAWTVAAMATWWNAFTYSMEISFNRSFSTWNLYKGWKVIMRWLMQKRMARQCNIQKKNAKYCSNVVKLSIFIIVIFLIIDFFSIFYFPVKTEEGVMTCIAKKQWTKLQVMGWAW